MFTLQCSNPLASEIQHTLITLFQCWCTMYIPYYQCPGYVRTCIRLHAFFVCEIFVLVFSLFLDSCTHDIICAFVIYMYRSKIKVRKGNHFTMR